MVASMAYTQQSELFPWSFTGVILFITSTLNASLSSLFLPHESSMNSTADSNIILFISAKLLKNNYARNPATIFFNLHQSRQSYIIYSRKP